MASQQEGAPAPAPAPANVNVNEIPSNPPPVEQAQDKQLDAEELKKKEEEEALKKSKALKLSPADIVKEADKIKSNKLDKVKAEISIAKVVANAQRVQGEKVVLYSTGNFSPLHNGKYKNANFVTTVSFTNCFRSHCIT